MSEKKVNEKKVKEALDESSKKAEEMLKDKKGLDDFIKNLEDNLDRYPKLGAVIEDVKTMIAMIKSYINKEYTQIPIASILATLGALIYLVNPFDLIPDVIPIIGQVDDIAVIALALKACQVDIENYRKWAAEQAAAKSANEQA